MNHLLFIGNLGAGEIIVIALVVLLLFGGKKIPELMKGLGKGALSRSRQLLLFSGTFSLTFRLTWFLELS